MQQRFVFFVCIVLWQVFSLLSSHAQKLDASLHESVESIPVGQGFSEALLETTIFKPEGKGPFPLIIINHGKAPGNPYFQAKARYSVAAKALVERGYWVVIPMRRGFSKSTGAYLNPGCNIYSNGLTQAEDIRDVIHALSQRPEVDATRVAVFGQSHGGLTTLALGSMNITGVRGLVNFAGGLRIESCQWESSLKLAFEKYATQTRLPSLWFYGDNDSYWGSQLPHELLRKYNEAGGQATMVSFGIFEGGDAHAMFSSSRGLSIWLKPVMEYLSRVGMSTDSPVLH